MRVNLNVPYAEKDLAKALGARWDVAKRVWYVEDLPRLEPFLRWMPKHLTAPSKPVVSKPKVAAKRQVKSKKSHLKAMNRLEEKKQDIIYGPVTPRTDFSLKDTGCSCPPWEWCEHNPEPANPKPAFVYRAQCYVEAVAPEHLGHIRSILAG